MSIYLTQFFTIVLVHILAVASPGPDFAIVVKNSLKYGRDKGVVTSIGVGMGIFIHVGYCLLGIGLIISKSIVIFSIMKYVAAAYLIFIGIKALGTKAYKNGSEEFETGAISRKEAFLNGFVTNGLNPKATLFFLALFTVVIKQDTPLYIQGIYGVYLAIATAIWFTFVSFIFGNEKVRGGVKKMGHWIDRAMGGILIALGLKIAFSEIK